MERAVDIVANHLDLDPAVVRSNMIPPEAMPYDVGLTYRDGVPMVYDSGDYPEALRRALDALGGLDVIRKDKRCGRQQISGSRTWLLGGGHRRWPLRRSDDKNRLDG